MCPWYSMHSLIKNISLCGLVANVFHALNYLSSAREEWFNRFEYTNSNVGSPAIKFIFVETWLWKYADAIPTNALPFPSQHRCMETATHSCIKNTPIYKCQLHASMLRRTNSKTPQLFLRLAKSYRIYFCHIKQFYTKQYYITVWLCDFCVLEGINQTARRIHLVMALDRKNCLNVFFRDISPLLVMFRIAGGLPIRENYDRATKQYSVQLKFLSPWMMSSLLMNGLQIYTIAYLSSKAYQVQDQIYKLIFQITNFSKEL